MMWVAGRGGPAFKTLAIGGRWAWGAVLQAWATPSGAGRLRHAAQADERRRPSKWNLVPECLLNLPLPIPCPLDGGPHRRQPALPARMVLAIFQVGAPGISDPAAAECFPANLGVILGPMLRTSYKTSSVRCFRFLRPCFETRVLSGMAPPLARCNLGHYHGVPEETGWRLQSSIPACSSVADWHALDDGLRKNRARLQDHRRRHGDRLGSPRASIRTRPPSSCSRWLPEACRAAPAAVDDDAAWAGLERVPTYKDQQEEAGRQRTSPTYGFLG